MYTPIARRAKLGAIVASALFAMFSVDAVAMPISVTIAGSLQSELGCPGDWQPECSASQLTFDAVDDIWQNTFGIPAGIWEYKAALNGSWDENYGLGAAPNGPNIPLQLSDSRSVKFFYDHKTNWVTDNVNSVIAGLASDFQSEIGCTGDWDPGCLRSWLQDPDGDGIYTFATDELPPGTWQLKIVHDEGWDENYGRDGVRNGANIMFMVPDIETLITFAYDPSTHLLTITPQEPVPTPVPPSLLLAGIGLVGLGLAHRRTAGPRTGLAGSGPTTAGAAPPASRRAFPGGRAPTGGGRRPSAA
jgi:hypothetical protein